MAALGAASAARAAPNGAPEPQPSHPPERDFVGLAHGRALAGVCRKTVKNALKEAQRHGLLGIEERRLSAWRNAPNVVTITSREWGAWLRMRGRGEGVKRCPPRIQENKKGTSEKRNRTWAAEGQGTGRDEPRRDSGEADGRSLTQAPWLPASRSPR